MILIYINSDFISEDISKAAGRVSIRKFSASKIIKTVKQILQVTTNCLGIEKRFYSSKHYRNQNKCSV